MASGAIDPKTTIAPARGHHVRIGGGGVAEGGGEGRGAGRGAMQVRDIFIVVLLTAHSAAAQIDVWGNWVSSQRLLRPRGNAGIGDYPGLPLNDAAAAR